MSRTSDLSRRQFAARAAAWGATLAFGSSCASAPRAVRAERRDLYPQGVASGDPDPESVLLWTRRAPDPGASAHRLAVEVASDEAFAHVVARGEVEVSARTDWTCRFLAAGLRPAREYWYRFVDEAGNASRTGRTLTAPAADDERPVRFAFVSCQDVTNSAMNAYRRMLYEDARRPRAEQLSFVLHLGDFFYEMVWYPEENPDGKDRGRRLRDVVRYPRGEKVRNFHVPVDLEDYRTAYRGYLMDPDLQDARARWPFVAVWDNHEFSWQGFQSQQVFGGVARPAQRLKLAASQAWYEYQPARVTKPGQGDAFQAPDVSDAALTTFDARGVSPEPNNLTAIQALRIYRSFRFGKNVDLILTDNRSFMGPPADGSGFPDNDFGLFPEEWDDILDQGREYNGGHPPATIRAGDVDVPNKQADKSPQSYLGLEQMAWFKRELCAARAPWKIWGHSFGTLTWRTDPQNLPQDLVGPWPGAGYGVLNSGYAVEKGEIFRMVREEGITGFAIVAGDKHSFWAGYPSETLPPKPFEPVGVEFVTGSISQQGLFEVHEVTLPHDHPLRALYLHDRPDGTKQCALNMTLRHGVRSALVLKETGDPVRARAARNPDVAPHLAFTDFGGHGY
ncbi:MAG: alkaline phosphatase D family protein, partial [Planctomycetota bacterium]